MKLKLENNWTTNNNGKPLNDSEVARYISVVPSQRQLNHSKSPFYCFIHFGMNTATGREWGNAAERVEDFNITSIDAEQWVKVIKASGAEGIILTCKHHDGFCLWDTRVTNFNVMYSPYGKDIVKQVSTECVRQGLKFGVYLSPWDMHEKTYGKPEYNDYFCTQLGELLTDYGNIFEVWFDGAKGANAVAFEYDWERYYSLVRTLQPNANIAICGPDIRWVGNEAGKCRRSEFSVVPKALMKTETIHEKSQQGANDAARLKKVDSADEDLGSRKVLSKSKELAWYPAEVDVSIRRGWFYPGRGGVKSAKRLFNIYVNSVGNNCTLLLNVPPNKSGVIAKKDSKALKGLGKKIKAMTEKPVLVQSFGELKPNDQYFDFNFDSEKSLKYCIISEDITKSQRVEKFDLYLKRKNGRYTHAYSGTVIGSKKIIKLKGKSTGAIFVIRQSRSTPHIAEIGFYQ
ncbi:MAG: alpha-L-fucosidase [Eubacterium sp.]